MLCCHVIKVMTHIGIKVIPEAYILKRWGWDAEEMIGEPDGNANPPQQSMPEDKKAMMELASYRDEFRKVAKIGVKHADGRKVIRTHLKQMKQELDVIRKREEKKVREAEEEAITMPSSSAATAPVPPVKTGPSSIRRTSSNIFVHTAETSESNIKSTKHVENPPVSTTKGRPQEIANKNPLDLAVKKARKCSFCGEINHTIRKCPERLKLLGYKL